MPGEALKGFVTWLPSMWRFPVAGAELVICFVQVEEWIAAAEEIL